MHRRLEESAAQPGEALFGQGLGLNARGSRYIYGSSYDGDAHVVCSRADDPPADQTGQSEMIFEVAILKYTEGIAC